MKPEIRKKVLIISGTAVISGAEYVLADYLKATSFKSGIMILHSDIPDVNKFYSGLGVKTKACAFLNPSGADKTRGIMPVIIKVFRYVTAVINLPFIIISSGAEKVAGNNTGDAVYSPAAFFTGRKFISHVHDIMDKKSLTSAAVRLLDVFVWKYVAVSGAVKASLADMGIVPAKITTVYNGVNAAAGLKKKKAATAISIAFAGNIEDRKNPLEFVRFINYLNKAGIVANGKIACANVPDEALMEKLKDEVKQGGGAVKILGKVSRDKMDGFYASADYLMVTSISDPLPTVVIEAFNKGVPVIGKRSGGLPEMIRDGYNGFLYGSDSDFKGLAGKLMAIKSAAYAGFRQNALDTVKEKFALGMKTDKMDAIFFKEERPAGKR